MIHTYLIGLGWIGGLLVQALPWGWVWPLVVSGIGAYWGRGDRRLVRTWLVTGLVALVAWGYIQVRLPAPGPRDVSTQAPQFGVTVVGEVTSLPRETRAGRLQVWLQARSIEPSGDQRPTQSVNGRLYVTYDQVADGADLHPSQVVALTGTLYVPSGAANPGAFDFQQYLAQRGAFAGLSAQQVTVVEAGRSWGGWAMRRRIQRAFVAGLGPEQGQLLSGLILGAGASQVAFVVQDAFRTVGLAHVLAASGFHVALLVGAVVALTQRLGRRQQQIVTLAVLGFYVVMTGGSPSILRAALMGAAAVIGTGVVGGPGRGGRWRPLGLLLLVAVTLLVIVPHWIWNLSFQLSFMATLGLLVMAGPVAKRLNHLPPTLAQAIAIPVAALIWTLPLQLAIFGRISVYVLLANLITLPLVIITVVGGFAGGAISLVLPALGSGLVPVLGLFLVPLRNLVLWIASWPAPVLYTGVISWVQCVGFYGLLVAFTFWPQTAAARSSTAILPPNLLAPGTQGAGTKGAVPKKKPWLRQPRSWAIAGLGALLLLPWLSPGPAVQMTSLATDGPPVLVIRSGGQTAVVNSGSPETVERVLLPFLRYHGWGRIQQAIALNPSGASNSGWGSLAAALPIEQFWQGDNPAIANEYGAALGALMDQGVAPQTLQVGDQLTVGNQVNLEVLLANPLILRVQAADQTWLLLGEANRTHQATLLNPSSPVGEVVRSREVNWLWWDGSPLLPDLVQPLLIEGAIAAGDRLASENESLLPSQALYQTNQVGAITWTPRQVILRQPLLD